MIALREDCTEAIRRHATVVEDGEVVVTGLPLKKGQEVEVILLTDIAGHREPVPLTARRLLQSAWRLSRQRGDC
jgi:hypothetical protein